MRDKLKFVIDTNIFVSGLINKRGAARKLIVHLVSKHVTLIICQEIYDEYEFVLLNSNLIDLNEANELLYFISQVAHPYEITNMLEICKDKADNKFLEAAVVGSVDYLVTKNIKHFPFKEYKNIKIVKVAKGLTAIEKQLHKQNEN